MSLRVAADEEKARGGAGEGVERRLLGLLGCKNEDLPNHLRHAISFLKSKDAPVDYRRLMQDLSFWDREGGRVQRGWGRDFWGGIEQETEGKA
jgi:CRISPR type I-E-associated protein CasB/Cse2